LEGSNRNLGLHNWNYELRIPKKPPELLEALSKITENRRAEPEVLPIIFSQKIVDEKGEYRHWDKMRHIPPPEGISSLEWWVGTRYARKSAAKSTPFTDKFGNELSYCVTEMMEEDLHWIDVHAAGSVKSEIDSGGETYIIKSLVEEAINSSQLEGASTTRHVAKEMIRKRREPVDLSERMILNNFKAMQFIKEIGDENLALAEVLMLHEVLTQETMDVRHVGSFRDEADDVYVEDNEGEILHIPPAATELADRMTQILGYANGETEGGFTHPVIRAIILHFMIGYDHPFVDGNGRTARALFYWSMKKSGYWLIEYVSLSKAIKDAPVQYGQAYLLSESDDGDLTYFLINQLKMIRRSAEEYLAKLQQKIEETKEARRFLDASNRFKKKLNARQLALLKHAIRNPGHQYTIEEHKNSHGVSYEPARRDLVAMADLGLLHKTEQGRKFIFTAPEDMREILQLSEDKLQQSSDGLKGFFSLNKF